jgi:hypothetical protein
MVVSTWSVHNIGCTFSVRPRDIRSRTMQDAWNCLPEAIPAEEEERRDFTIRYTATQRPAGFLPRLALTASSNWDLLSRRILPISSISKLSRQHRTAEFKRNQISSSQSAWASNGERASRLSESMLASYERRRKENGYIACTSQDIFISITIRDTPDLYL